LLKFGWPFRTFDSSQKEHDLMIGTKKKLANTNQDCPNNISLGQSLTNFLGPSSVGLVLKMFLVNATEDAILIASL